MTPTLPDPVVTEEVGDDGYYRDRMMKAVLQDLVEATNTLIEYLKAQEL